MGFGVWNLASGGEDTTVDATVARPYLPNAFNRLVTQMIAFKRNASDHVIILRNRDDLSREDMALNRSYKPGERVLLHPNVAVRRGRPDWLRAEVLSVGENGLRVRALHGFDPLGEGTQLVAIGDEFEVEPGAVFSVEPP